MMKYSVSIDIFDIDIFSKHSLRDGLKIIFYGRIEYPVYEFRLPWICIFFP